MGKCMGKMCKVKVVRNDGVKMQIKLCETQEEMEKITVLQLKEKIAERFPEDPWNRDLRLKFKERMLDEDSKFLSEYGIQHKSVIHMMEHPKKQNLTSPLYGISSRYGRFSRQSSSRLNSYGEDYGYYLAWKRQESNSDYSSNDGNDDKNDKKHKSMDRLDNF